MDNTNSRLGYHVWLTRGLSSTKNHSRVLTMGRSAVFCLWGGSRWVVDVAAVVEVGKSGGRGGAERKGSGSCRRRSSAQPLTPMSTDAIRMTTLARILSLWMPWTTMSTVQ